MLKHKKEDFESEEAYRKFLWSPISDEKVRERVSHIDKTFIPDNFKDKKGPIVSPSGRYTLEIETYTTGKGTWDYTQGIVKSNIDGGILFRIRRNYSSFWHCFVLHSNGYEYLLCGEDYQGYTVVNLTKRTLRTILTNAVEDGFGFCWAGVEPSPDGNILAVSGCHWGGPYDVHMMDFTDPEALPLVRLGSFDEQCRESLRKWLDNTSYQYERYQQPLVSGKEIDDDGDVVDEEDGYLTEIAVWRKNENMPV
jgi:hypothetical protein